jgi:excisionase family DNA binding protein
MSELDADDAPLAEHIAQRRAERPFEVLDLAAAAALLHVHPDTLRRMAKTGQIPATKVGRAWVFSAQLVQEWFEARCTAKSTTPASSGGASLADRLNDKLDRRLREMRHAETPEMRALERTMQQHPENSPEAVEARGKLRKLRRALHRQLNS